MYWAEVHHWSQVEHILDLRPGLVLWWRFKESDVFCHGFPNVLTEYEKKEKGRSEETGSADDGDRRFLGGYSLEAEVRHAWHHAGIKCSTIVAIPIMVFNL